MVYQIILGILGAPISFLTTVHIFKCIESIKVLLMKRRKIKVFTAIFEM